MDETRLAILAAFAAAGGGEPDEAWQIAREVAAEVPDDFEAASALAVRRGRQVAHP